MQHPAYYVLHTTDNSILHYASAPYCFPVPLSSLLDRTPWSRRLLPHDYQSCSTPCKTTLFFYIFPTTQWHICRFQLPSKTIPSSFALLHFFQDLKVFFKRIQNLTCSPSFLTPIPPSFFFPQFWYQKFLICFYPQILILPVGEMYDR